MPKPESSLQRRIQRAIEEFCEDSDYKCWGFKIHGGPYQSAGIPDLMYIVEGKSFFFEVKMPGKLATSLQQATIDALNEAGAHAYVVDNPRDAVLAVYAHMFTIDDELEYVD